MKTILQAAIDSWPEDEAYGLCSQLGQNRIDYPEEDHMPAFRKDCARMETFFAREEDAADLIARFRAEVLKLSGVTLLSH